MPAATLTPHINRLRSRYAQHEEVLLYLNEVVNDILDTVAIFRPDTDDDEEAASLGIRPPPFVVAASRYQAGTFDGHIGHCLLGIKAQTSTSQVDGSIVTRLPDGAGELAPAAPAKLPP